MTAAVAEALALIQTRTLGHSEDCEILHYMRTECCSYPQITVSQDDLACCPPILLSFGLVLTQIHGSVASRSTF